jgi:hypothetical protein
MKMKKTEQSNTAVKEDSASELECFLMWLQEHKLFLSRRHAHAHSCRQDGGDLSCGYGDESFEPMLLDRPALIAKFRSARNVG